MDYIRTVIGKIYIYIPIRLGYRGAADKYMIIGLVGYCKVLKWKVPPEEIVGLELSEVIEDQADGYIQ